MNLEQNLAGRRKFGVTAKLQAAFGAVAALTVLTAAVGIGSYSTIERGFEELAGQQVPLMNDAMRLSNISSNISAAAARFVSAKTADDQKAITALIERNRIELAAITAQVRKTAGERPAFKTFVAVSDRLAANLAALEETISERTEFSSRLEERLEAAHKARSHISEQLARQAEPRSALEVLAQTYLIMSLLSEGSIVKEAAVLRPIQERFKAASEMLGMVADEASPAVE
jgi:phosphoglycerate-specific signal transduction histidine kinase